MTGPVAVRIDQRCARAVWCNLDDAVLIRSHDIRIAKCVGGKPVAGTWPRWAAFPSSLEPQDLRLLIV